MDLTIIGSTIIAFLKIWIPLAVVGFVLYKIFSPLRKKLADKYDFSWFRSALILNYLVIFVFLLIVFIFFMALGSLDAPVRDPEIEYNMLENLGLVAIGALRILVVAFIVTMILVLFEMISSLVTEYALSREKPRARKKLTPSLLSQFAGVLVASAIFVILLLFIFDWVPLGLFIFMFYGKVGELPLLLLLI